MTDSFNTNLFNSMEICNSFQHNNPGNNSKLYTLNNGCFYSDINVMDSTMYLIYKKEPKSICFSMFNFYHELVDFKTIIYLSYDKYIGDFNKKTYSLLNLDVDSKKNTKILSFVSYSLYHFVISEDKKFFVISDIFQNLNMYSIKDKKIIKSINFKHDINNDIETISLSPNNDIIICIKKNVIIFWYENTIKNIDISSENIQNYYNCKIFFGKENDITIGFSNGTILYLKNREIISKTIRNLKTDDIFFSKNGNILCVNNKNIFKLFHKDADEYSNEISYIEHKSGFPEERRIFGKDKNHICGGYISPDEKFFFIKNRNKITSYDISFIGYKKCQKLTFLTGIINKNCSVNSFLENVLFDINLVKLIFDFLPFSKEIKN